MNIIPSKNQDFQQEKYFVAIFAMGNYPEIAIDREKFDELKKAKENLSELFAFEEKYELLLSNYLELEKENLIVTAETMIERNQAYEKFFSIRLLFNQRIVNLLSTARLYLDQIHQHIHPFMLISVDVKALLSTEYDNNFEYRFMEALRNYVQHRGLAVHSTNLESRWTSLDTNGEMQFKTQIFTNKNEVEKDNAFKKSVSNEMPDKVDLMFASRSYIESISKVHCAIRDHLKEIAIKERNIISDVMDEYKIINSGNITGLSIVHSQNDGHSNQILEQLYLTLEWDDIRLALINKNASLVNLKKRYVSGSTK